MKMENRRLRSGEEGRDVILYLRVSSQLELNSGGGAGVLSDRSRVAVRVSGRGGGTGD